MSHHIDHHITTVKPGNFCCQRYPKFHTKMFAISSRIVVRSIINPRWSRTFAEDAVKTASEAKSKPPGRIAGFFSRVSSFLVGAGLTALATQYYIFEEVRNGNKIMLEKQKDIEKRLKLLEK